MMMRIAGSMLLLAGLAACGNEVPRQANQMKSVRVTSEYIEKLKALRPANQGLALRRAVQDSGSRCKRVEAAGYQEDYRNLSMWTARCSDTGDWALFIAPNGSVQVRKCAEAEQLGLPECRIPAAGISYP